MAVARLSQPRSLVQSAVETRPRKHISDLPNQPSWSNKASNLVVDDDDAIGALSEKIAVSPDGTKLAKGFDLMIETDNYVRPRGYKAVTYKYMEDLLEWRPLAPRSPLEVHVDNKKFGQSGAAFFDMTMASKTVGIHYWAIIDDKPIDEDDDKIPDPVSFTGCLHLWKLKEDGFSPFVPYWEDIQPPIENNSTNKDQELFGKSLSLAEVDDTVLAAVGIPAADANDDDAPKRPGRVQVYKYATGSPRPFQDGQWEPLGSPILGENGLFGDDVALSRDGSILSVMSGFPNTDPSEGPPCSVRVYEYSEKDKDWKQLGGELKASSSEQDDDKLTCGSMELSADGMTVAVGDRVSDPGCPMVPKPVGHVRVWSYDPSSKSWSRKGQDLDTLIPLLRSEESYSIGWDLNLDHDGSKVTVSVTEGIPGSFLFSHSYIMTFGWDTKKEEWVQKGGPLSLTKEMSFSSSMSDDGKTLVATYQDSAIRQGIIESFRFWSQEEEEDEKVLVA